MADTAPIAAELGGTSEVPIEEVGRLGKAKDAVIELTDKAKTRAIELKDKAVCILKDPQFQTCTIATASGTVTIGAAGGAFGLAVGTVTGSAVGVVPALLTFGLSIPVGAAVGGGMGLCTGAAAGGSVGAAAALGSYKYRVEIKDGVIYVKTLALDTVGSGKRKTLALVKSTKTRVSEAAAAAHAKADGLAQCARTRATEAAGKARVKAGEALDFATGTKTGVACSAAAAGVIVGGAGGGAVGTVTGGAIGLVPALFTFGLSIPVGAAVGLCIGAAAGGTAGAVGGGSIGYGGYSYRKEIGDCAEGARSRARQASEYVKERLHGPADAKAGKVDGQQPEGTAPVVGA